MARNMTALDVGAGSAVAVHGRFEKGSFRMAGFAAAEGGSFADAYGALELPFKPSAARVAISGKDLNVRYTRVPQVPDWQLRRLMRGFEQTREATLMSLYHAPGEEPQCQRGWSDFD